MYQVCLRIDELYRNGKVAEARDMQLQLAKMENGFGKGGINGTKWVVAKLRGYSEGSWHCRRPYPQFDDAARQQWVMETVQLLSKLEQKLANIAP